VTQSEKEALLEQQETEKQEELCKKREERSLTDRLYSFDE
jgi:hypothetical protein